MRKLALKVEAMEAVLEAQIDCGFGLWWCDLLAARTIAGRAVAAPAF
jgi:hypothetical protein